MRPYARSVISDDEGFPGHAPDSYSVRSVPIRRADEKEGVHVPANARKMVVDALDLSKSGLFEKLTNAEKAQLQSDPELQRIWEKAILFNKDWCEYLSGCVHVGSYGAVLGFFNHPILRHVWVHGGVLKYFISITSRCMMGRGMVHGFRENVKESLKPTSQVLARPVELGPETFWMFFLCNAHTLDTIQLLYNALPRSQRERAIATLIISPGTPQNSVSFLMSQVICNLLVRYGTGRHHMWLKTVVLPQLNGKVFRSSPAHVQALEVWMQGTGRGFRVKFSDSKGADSEDGEEEEEKGEEEEKEEEEEEEEEVPEPPAGPRGVPETPLLFGVPDIHMMASGLDPPVPPELPEDEEEEEEEKKGRVPSPPPPPVAAPAPPKPAPAPAPPKPPRKPVPPPGPPKPLTYNKVKLAAMSDQVKRAYADYMDSRDRSEDAISKERKATELYDHNRARLEAWKKSDASEEEIAEAEADLETLLDSVKEARAESDKCVEETDRLKAILDELVSKEKEAHTAVSDTKAFAAEVKHVGGAGATHEAKVESAVVDAEAEAARKKAEEEAVRKKKEEEERMAKEAALRVEEEERKKKEEAARKKKEDEERALREAAVKAKEEELKKKEEERKRKEEEERKAKEEERKRKEEEELKAKEEERKRKEEEKRRVDEAERKRKEEEERKAKEALRMAAEEERLRREEEARKAAEEEERMRREDEEQKAREEEERRRRAEERELAEKYRLIAEADAAEARRKAEAEKLKKSEEAALKREKEAERKRKEEEKKSVAMDPTLALETASVGSGPKTPRATELPEDKEDTMQFYPRRGKERVEIAATLPYSPHAYYPSDKRPAYAEAWLASQCQQAYNQLQEHLSEVTNQRKMNKERQEHYLGVLGMANTIADEIQTDWFRSEEEAQQFEDYFNSFALGILASPDNFDVGTTELAWKEIRSRFYDLRTAYRNRRAELAPALPADFKFLHREYLKSWKPIPERYILNLPRKMRQFYNTDARLLFNSLSRDTTAEAIEDRQMLQQVYARIEDFKKLDWDSNDTEQLYSILRIFTAGLEGQAEDSPQARHLYAKRHFFFRLLESQLNFRTGKRHGMPRAMEPMDFSEEEEEKKTEKKKKKKKKDLAAEDDTEDSLPDLETNVPYPEELTKNLPRRLKRWFNVDSRKVYRDIKNSSLKKDKKGNLLKLLNDTARLIFAFNRDPTLWNRVERTFETMVGHIVDEQQAKGRDMFFEIQTAISGR